MPDTPVVQAEPTAAEVATVLKPETVKPTEYRIGSKMVAVRPLPRRWQQMFFASAWYMIEAELAAKESILKSLVDETATAVSWAKDIGKGFLQTNENLDRAAAVILASQAIGAEQTPDRAIQASTDFLLDNSTTDELMALVKAQIEVERLVDRVGEYLPARFTDLLTLAGSKESTASLMQLLNSSLLNSAAPTGAGSST